MAAPSRSPQPASHPPRWDTCGSRAGHSGHACALGEGDPGRCATPPGGSRTLSCRAKVPKGFLGLRPSAGILRFGRGSPLTPAPVPSGREGVLAGLSGPGHQGV